MKKTSSPEKDVIQPLEMAYERKETTQFIAILELVKVYLKSERSLSDRENIERFWTLCGNIRDERYKITTIPMERGKVDGATKKSG